MTDLGLSIALIVGIAIVFIGGMCSSYGVVDDMEIEIYPHWILERDTTMKAHDCWLPVIDSAAVLNKEIPVWYRNLPEKCEEIEIEE